MIFTSLFFTLVGSCLFVSSQGLIDLSKVLSITKGPSILPLTAKVDDDIPNQIQNGVSLWGGIVMQAVSIKKY